MKHSDEAVEKVLGGLRIAEAPQGMNQRILARAHALTAESSGTTWRRFRSYWLSASPLPTLAWGVIIVILIGIPAIHRLERDATAQRHTPAVLASPPLSKIEALASSKLLVLHGNHRRANIEPKIRRVQVIGRIDSDGLSDTQASSFPAPPMPLTNQEKLLLRIVHKGDRVEIAMLDPDVRSQRNAEGKAAFQRFFEPPTQGDTQ